MDPDFADDENGLAEQLLDQEAVIMPIPASKTKEHTAMMNACVKAGVRRMIPAD